MPLNQRVGLLLPPVDAKSQVKTNPSLLPLCTVYAVKILSSCTSGDLHHILMMSTARTAVRLRLLLSDL